MHRFYQVEPPVLGAEVTLSPEASAQVARVLRLRPGAGVVLFCGDGRECEAVLESVSPSRTTARVVGEATPVVELPCRLQVGVAALKGEKLDWVVQKLTELGASQILFIQTERTVVSAGEERWHRRILRYQRIAQEAAEQSGRVRVPQVVEPVRLEALLRSADTAHRFFLDPYAPHSLTVGLRPCPDAVLLLIGPEGGFTPAEVESARAAGARPVRLGARILRAETAAIAAATLVAAAAEAHLSGDPE